MNLIGRPGRIGLWRHAGRDLAQDPADGWGDAVVDENGLAALVIFAEDEPVQAGAQAAEGVMPLTTWRGSLPVRPR